MTDPLNVFWLCAYNDNSILTYDDFIAISKPVRDILLNTGLFRQGPSSSSVECDSCDAGHIEEVIQKDYPDGKRRFFIPCPHCISVQIAPERLQQWIPDYQKAAELLYQSLDCKGSSQTILPNLLWNIGRAALAGQSRPVWLARVINAEVRHYLPSGKQPLLFVIFPQQYRVDNFDPDRIFQMSELTSLSDGQLRFDVDAVESQLGYLIATGQSACKAPRKDAKRASVIKAAKHELHNHILSMKSLLANSDDILPRFSQRDLARRLGESEPMISRILKEPDELLGILWKTVNDEYMIRQYRRKSG
ncbi:MAG: hypothetical protein JEZ07_08775 [Phycisphaerae bacterium]|nr:hypothetical protein [Phycisphaerae bacterium]